MAAIAGSVEGSGNAAFSVEVAEEFLLCARYGEAEDMLMYMKEEYNVPVNYANPDSGNTALHLASANGHKDCVKILMLKGAKDAPNKTGNYALHWAVQNQHLPVVKLLLEQESADILKKNSFGKSALTEAFGRDNADITAALLTHSSAKELENQKKKKKKGGEDGKTDKKPKTPMESKVIQEKVHTFKFKEDTVKCREIALDWDGKAFQDNKAENDVTGINIWSASIVLSRWIVDNKDWFLNKKVCELGAGAGLPGLTCGSACNPETILITDYLQHCVENIEKNIEINSIDPNRGSSKAVDWSKEDTWPKSKGGDNQTFDVLLGSDLIYDIEMIPSLVSVASKLLSSKGIFLYVAPTTKRDGMEEFKNAILEQGDFELTETLTAPDSYYANPLVDTTQTECDLHFNELSSKTYTLYKWEKK